MSIVPTVEVQQQLSRYNMWRLKAVVNTLLAGKTPSFCMRHMTSKTVDIVKTPSTGKCRYTKLAICGSVWACPNCARRISQKRKEELAQAVTRARSLGETVLMVTQTFSHGYGDDLRDNLDKLRKAQRRFTTGKAAQKLREEFGLNGTIRALEVTYGANGFHPHLHTMWFLKNEPNRLRLKRRLFVLWYKACKKAGLKTSYKHGLDVSTSRKDVTTYIAKWGIEDEMTKANYKTGKKKGSVTPWGMLQAIADQDPQAEKYAKTFVHYADAMKGEHQLYWSPGLRKRLTVEEVSDTDICTKDVQPTEADIIMASLTIDNWVPITRYNMESTLLSTAETTPDRIMSLVLEAKHRYLQEKSDKECDYKGLPRVEVPMPDADLKLFTPRVVHNGERLADKADKELVFF